MDTAAHPRRVYEATKMKVLHAITIYITTRYCYYCFELLTVIQIKDPRG